MCVHTHLATNTSSHVCTHTRTHTHVATYACSHVCTHVHVATHTHPRLQFVSSKMSSDKPLLLLLVAQARLKFEKAEAIYKKLLDIEELDPTLVGREGAGREGECW